MRLLESAVALFFAVAPTACGGTVVSGGQDAGRVVVEGDSPGPPLDSGNGCACQSPCSIGGACCAAPGQPIQQCNSENRCVVINSMMCTVGGVPPGDARPMAISSPTRLRHDDERGGVALSPAPVTVPRASQGTERHWRGSFAPGVQARPPHPSRPTWRSHVESESESESQSEFSTSESDVRRPSSESDIRIRVGLGLEPRTLGPAPASASNLERRPPPPLTAESGSESR